MVWDERGTPEMKKLDSCKPVISFREKLSGSDTGQLFAVLTVYIK